MGSRIGKRLRFALAALIVVTLGACSRSVHFTTGLDSVDGLAPGNPVTSRGTQIGQVARVSRDSRGGAEVGFDVEHASAAKVHEDSIAVLHTGGDTPSLDVLSPNPSSPVAASGSRIQGASSEAQARMLIASRGLGALLGGFAQFLGSLGARAGSTSSSPAFDALSRQLAAIQQSIAAGAAANQAVVRAELDRLAAQSRRLQQELIRQGRTAEAERLKQEIARLMRSLTPPPPSRPPNTLVTPKVYPSR